MTSTTIPSLVYLIVSLWGRSGIWEQILFQKGTIIIFSPRIPMKTDFNLSFPGVTIYSKDALEFPP